MSVATQLLFSKLEHIFKEGIIITYKDFIDNILNTRGRFSCGEEYHERHHILPKSCGGTNDEDNLIDLFAREHFIAHKLLAEENPNNQKLIYAYMAMSVVSNENKERYKLTPKEYEKARTTFSNMLKNRYKDKENHPSYGTHISEERKRIIGDANRGNKYSVGRVVSEETRKKISEANKNPSKETRKKWSEARKGKGLGASNPNAKPVIRLSDRKVYGCAKDAATDNNIKYSTFKGCRLQKDKDFMYYDKWLQQNNLENNIC